MTKSIQIIAAPLAVIVLLLTSACPGPVASSFDVKTADVSSYVTNWTQKANAGELPAYVSATAPSIFEVSKVVTSLQKNSDEKGIRNNIVLVGESSVDTDLRVQALAWCVAKGCAGVPDSFKSRQIISVDFKKLQEDSVAHERCYAMALIFTKAL